MLLDDGITAVMAALKKALPEGTDSYNMVFQLETRLNATNKDRIRGILSQEQLELAYNRITADLLDLLDGLQVTDFQQPGTEGAAAVAKTGSILYRVPHTMEVEQEYRCVVRLAFDEEVIIRNIEITRDTVLKSVRVAEVMEVELLDPNGVPAFAIRRLNSAEQFLEKQDYTEWIFFVKPLRTGELPLMLRIAVLEIIDEHERKKEIVLEELIHVVADAVEPGDPLSVAPFRSTGYTVAAGAVGGESDRSTRPPAHIPPSSDPALPSAPAQSQSGGKRRSALAALALLLLVAGIWAAGHLAGWWRPGPSEQEQQADRAQWQQALALGTRDAFLTYLAQYPQGTYRLLAQFKLDSIEQAQRSGTESSGLSGPSAPSYTPPDFNDTLPEEPASSAATSPLAGSAGKKLTDKPRKPTKPLAAAPSTQTGGTSSTPPPTPDVALPPPPSKRRSGFEMVKVAGGTMTLGCDGGGKDECPYSATIPAFQIGKYEVTQGDWKEIMGSNPAHFNYNRCDECPVERVSWEEVQVFLRKASEKYHAKFRLPFEREWEYAARGGAGSKGFKYSGSDRSGDVGWYHDNSEETHRVGQKRPNELGLHDMSGNVWEWCMDTYKPYPGCKSRSTDDRIIRGGSFRNYASKSRTCNRNYKWPTEKDYTIGFRLVRE